MNSECFSQIAPVLQVHRGGNSDIFVFRPLTPFLLSKMTALIHLAPQMRINLTGNERGNSKSEGRKKESAKRESEKSKRSEKNEK